MPPSVFLSHNKADKVFVRRLARDLDNQGVPNWLDEAEITAGQSLIERIRDGIDSMEFLAVVLSPDSVSSAWVLQEVDVAMNQEIAGGQVKVLPLMYRNCELPGFLLGKRYVDFTDEQRYSEAFEDLLRSIGVVFNRVAFAPPAQRAHLGEAIDKAWKRGLPLLQKPFHRPQQYMGMTVEQAERATGGQANEGGNIVLDTEDCHMVLEAEGNFIKYIDAELKATAPHRQDQEFDSVPVLGAFSINPAELEQVRKRIHFHTYYDHRKKLKVSVSCIYDGAPLSVGFSSKYYGM